MSWIQQKLATWLGVTALREQGEALMRDFTDLETKVRAMTDVGDGMAALLGALAEEIKALQPNQASIDALASAVASKTSVWSTIVAENTKADPAPVTAVPSLEARRRTG